MYQVEITDICYKGTVKRTQTDEYVEVTNLDKESADISGWMLCSSEGQFNVFTFPDGTLLAPSQSVRVYTNEVHPESGGFSANSRIPIWKDLGDEALLYDANRFMRSSLAYDSKGNFTRTLSANMFATDFERAKAKFDVPNLKVEISLAEIEARVTPETTRNCVDALLFALQSFILDQYQPHSIGNEVKENPECFGLAEGDEVTTIVAEQKVRERLNSDAVISLWQEEIPADPEAASNPLDDAVKVFFEFNELEPSDFWVFRLDGFKNYYFAASDKKGHHNTQTWGVSPDDLI